MKKLSAVILMIVLAIGFFFIGSIKTNDISKMSYDSLYSLKQSVDVEFFSRPESEPLVLFAGQYTVGKDIKPGKYYVIKSDPSSTYTDVRVYANESKFERQTDGSADEFLTGWRVSRGQKPISLFLQKGNYLVVSGLPLKFSVSEFKDNDLYKYIPPKGVYLASGIYKIGNNLDIPIGVYSIYAGTIKGGEAKLYFSESKYIEDTLGYDYDKEFSVNIFDSYSVKLDEGNVILVKEDIIITKQLDPKFD